MFNLLYEIGKIISFALSLPKSLIVNFRYLPLSQAIRLPILISHRIKLNKLNGSIQLDRVKTGIVQIGFGSLGQNSGRQDSVWCLDGAIRFRGKTRIGCGVKLMIHGKLTLGNNLIASHNFFITCSERVDIDDDALFSWNVTIMDTDSHSIYQDGQQINRPSPISIGKHVWTGCDTLILKGTHIGMGSVIAARSVVTASTIEASRLIAGAPAKVIKHGISWE